MKTTNARALTSPRPVKLDKCDDQFLVKVSFDTGLSVSDLMRRSVRLMRRQTELLKGYSFILDLR